LISRKEQAKITTNNSSRQLKINENATDCDESLEHILLIMQSGDEEVKFAG